MVVINQEMSDKFSKSQEYRTNLPDLTVSYEISGLIVDLATDYIISK